MRIRTTWATLAVLILLAANTTLTVINSQQTPRLAYVRSQELVYGYFGMKEAMTEFQNKRSTWKANVDTLAMDLKRTIDRANIERTAMSPAQFQEKQQIIQKQQKDLFQYQDVIDEKIKEEEQRMLGAVLDQVNAFVEGYAKDHGYDAVLGTTDAGSLLYGEGEMDITSDLLLALNKNYSGQ